MSEGSKDKFGAYPAGTGEPDNPEVGRVLKPAYPGQIRCTVTAPVTQKRRDFGFPFGHCISSPSF